MKRKRRCGEQHALRQKSRMVQRLARWGSAGLPALIGLLLLTRSPVSAFQFFFFFEGPSSMGEGGRRYFTGSPRYKNYDCRICHVHSPGNIRVNLWTEPENVFLNGYRPETTYTVHVRLEEETRAPKLKIFSTNNFCFEVLDSAGRNAGMLDPGFPFNPISQLFDPVVLSPDGTTVLSGFFNFDLSWEWLWTAPASGTGELTFYLGFVDGNGDIKSFSDDVAVLKAKAVERP